MLGWSGRSGGRAAGGFEQIHPLVLTVPAFGHVHGEVPAAVPGDARRDIDEVTAQGGAAGFGAGEAGQGPGGVQQVTGDSRERDPGGVGRKGTGGSLN